jgi:hypothetical protein
VGATATATTAVAPIAGQPTSTPVSQTLPQVGTPAATPGAQPTPAEVLPITGQAIANLIPLFVLVGLAGVIFGMGLYMRRKRTSRDIEL